MEKINKKKISELPEAKTLNGFYAFGTDGNNNSVKVPINLLKGNEGKPGEKGEPGADGSDGGIQIVTDGDTISTDGEYLMTSEGTIIISTGIDAIPQSALNIVGALLPNGATNSNSGYYHTPMTAIPSGKTKILITPMSTMYGGRSLAFYNSAGTMVYILPNSDNHVPVLVEIPSTATQYMICRSTGDIYFAGFVSDSTQTYTNTDKITQIIMTNGAAIINELRTLTDPDMLRIVSNGETITENGNYLFIEDGTAEFVYEVVNSSEIDVPVNQISVNGSYINSDGQLLSSGYGYSRSPLLDIPRGASDFEVYSMSDGSAARALAFYTADEKFISAPDNKGYGVLVNAIRPASAAKYVISKNGSNPYQCKITAAGTKSKITNENQILLITKNGDVASSRVLRDFSKISIKTANRPKAFLKDFLLNGSAITSNTVNITGTGVATANQLRHKAYMSTENIHFSVVFKANAASSSVQIGRTAAGSARFENNTLTIYSSGTTVYKTETLPFSVTAGNTYTFSCDKLDALTLRYTISSDKGDNFSITLDKLMANIGYAALGWGVPFFGVINGEVMVKNAVLSFVYDFNTVLSIFGDSFIEGNSLINEGIYNKWSSLLGDEIGNSLIHISGKGGEVANTAFVNRFKIENSLFKSPFVILALGTNHSDLASYTPSMQQLIDECKANNQIPILQTIPPRSGIDYTKVTKAINDWVKASGELYIDFHTALTKSDDETVWKAGYVMSDGVHPTVRGHNDMLEQVKRDLCFLIN